MTRLAKRGWHLEVVCFECLEWPVALPLKVTMVPCPKAMPQLLKNIWFLIATRTLRTRTSPSSVIITAGTAAFPGDIRVVHFVHNAWWKVFHTYRLPLPNAATPLRYFYQWCYAAWEKYLETKILLRCQHIIAVSSRVAHDVSILNQNHHNRVPLPKITVIHHAANRQSDPQQKSTPRDIPVILFVGALERKGISKALDILALCRDLPWRFVAVGGGSLYHWQNYAEQKGIKDRVTFVGQTPATPYFSQADIFLFPSYYEPFGLVITEAITAGCLPLCAQDCGATELWSRRPSWLNHSVTTPDSEWALALRRLLNHPEERKHLMQSARDEVLAWTWDDATSAFETTIKENLSL